MLNDINSKIKELAENKLMLLRLIISFVAISIAIVHLIFPSLKIDSITVALLLIATVPWLSPLLKSIELPGGLKVEFQELKDKVDSMAAKESEPISDSESESTEKSDPLAAAILEEKTPQGAAITARGFSFDDNQRKIIKAIGNSKYTWRSMNGLEKETALDKQTIASSIEWLMANSLVTEIKNVRGQRGAYLWGLSPEGMEVFRQI